MPIFLRLLLAALACICIFGARAMTHQYNGQIIDGQHSAKNSLQDASAGSSPGAAGPNVELAG